LEKEEKEKKKKLFQSMISIPSIYLPIASTV